MSPLFAQDGVTSGNTGINCRFTLKRAISLWRGTWPSTRRSRRQRGVRWAAWTIPDQLEIHWDVRRPAKAGAASRSGWNSVRRARQDQL